MRRRILILTGIALLVIVGVVWFRPASQQRATVAQNNHGATTGVPTLRVPHITESVVSAATAPDFLTGKNNARSKTNLLAYRLQNTKQSVGKLVRNSHAILLENALIDTQQPVNFGLPDRLQSAGEPGSYIVQAKGAVDDAFRASLKAAGAEIISYIPNNSYLVRASAAAASQLSAQAGTQAVLPYEPVYKLKSELLAYAMDDEALPKDSKLNVLMFARDESEVLKSLEAQQLTVLGQGITPFGPVVTVQPGEDWVALARMPGVQLLELAYARKSANDLSRVRLGVAEDSTTGDNYLGLTGKGVTVGINDSGVDATHPDLVGRVFGANTNALLDFNGHGTHVGASIIGSGEKSLTVTNAHGSVNPATTNQYRGIAPQANLFVQTIGAGLGTTPDATLQQTTARTNVFISNNSWGYAGNSSYSLAAASYDAAVRDALPGVTGSQPVLFVFAAGNDGAGGDNGLGGDSSSVLSPGTGKNVLTVGAIELARDITNTLTIITTSGGITTTNNPAQWKGMTSSDNEVAWFSSRGNVGIGVEGDFGRFKPDVVAPGTFVISARSSQWDEQAYYNPTNHHYTTLADQMTESGKWQDYGLYLPDNAVGFSILVYPNSDSTLPFASLPLYVRKNGTASAQIHDIARTNFVSVPPDLAGLGGAVGQNWSYRIVNGTSNTVFYNILTEVITTNDLGNYFEVLSNLNNSITSTNGTGPHYYRYESGTSMAAGQVSGTLALMQEYFLGHGITNSPALMKALLINGARSAGNLYDFQVQNPINYQGWGLVKLNNSLQPGITNAFSHVGPTSMHVFDQSPTNALATGQSVTRFVTLDEDGRFLPLRVTLAWTDPAGNPIAGVKLVNDLDLIVTNLDDPANPIIYFGNDIPASSLYNFPWDTNNTANIDAINNVENVFIRPELGTNYSITVLARAVNVNAVTAHTNDTVQDFALVISSGGGEATNGVTLLSTTWLTASPPTVVYVSNSLNVATFSSGTLVGQHVGANTPLLGTTNGMTNQWRFYVMSNSTDFTNASFLISQQRNLATPRMGVFSDATGEHTRRYADLDLYVSTNAALTNLDPVVLATANTSLSRNYLSGDEFVAFTNSAMGSLYYIGVKSEDQQGGEFELWGIFSQLPLGAEDENGFVPAYPMLGYDIPDGSPTLPRGTRWVAITRASLTDTTETIRRVLITNNVSHERYGDIVAVVDHNSQAVTYDNHRTVLNPPYPDPPGPYRFFYDDSGENDYPNAVTPSGPGTFENFVGEAPGGTWYFTYSDDNLSQTGRVNYVGIRLDRQCESSCDITNEVAAFSWRHFVRNVPVEATNLTICLDIITPTDPKPLEIYVRKDHRPTLTAYDFKKTINPPQGCLTIDNTSLPPLSAGRYFISVYNPNNTSQEFVYRATVLLGPPPQSYPFSSSGNQPLLDDAVANYSIFITNTLPVAEVDVALRVDHPRVSDLAVTLISPQGTRVLLAENRGGTNTSGFGSTMTVTNFFPVTASGGLASNSVSIDTGATFGQVAIDYDFFDVPDQMTVYYEGIQLYNTGMINGAGRLNLTYGPGNSTLIEVRMNEFGNTNTSTAWNYAVSSSSSLHSYLIFTDNTNKTTTPIKFALPPFTGTLGTNYLLSDFEFPTLAQDYTGPTVNTPDGWDVLTNTVTVTTNYANTGNQSLGLRAGEIRRSLPVSPGRDYALTFAARGTPSCFQYTDFNSTGGLSLLGSAAVINGGVLRLNPAQPGPIGAAWFKEKQLCAAGFDTSFRFRVSGPFANDCGGELGGDNIIFAVQNISPTDMSFVGNTGGAANYVNVILNTFQNWPGCTDPLTCDVSDNSVGIGINGVYVAQRDLNSLGINLSDGNVHQARVTYAGSSMNVFIDNVAVLSNVTIPGLAPGVDGCGYGWVGLNAWSGCAYENHDIIDWSFCSSAPASTAQAMIPGVATNSFVGATSWVTKGITFRAPSTNVTINVQSLSPFCAPGVLVDTFKLTEASASRYVLPEESLKVLEGEPAYGLWQLEILDTRTGAINNVSLLDWQLQFIFQTNTPAPRVLTPGVPVDQEIPPGRIIYYVVDVPSFARFATNMLFTATPPLNFYFNQLRPPAFGATNANDVVFALNAANHVEVLSTTATVPPTSTKADLLPGERYYLAIENPNLVNATYTIYVDFDLSVFPPTTDLTNGVPYCTVNPVPFGLDYYHYTVSSNSVRAQFELKNLSGDMTLFLRRDLPPTFAVFDYLSANVYTNDEVITVFDFSQPVALAPGDWYIAAANLTTGPVSYCAAVREWAAYGTNIVVTNVFLGTNSFCLTWTSLEGIPYFVEGVTNLNSTNWVAVSPTVYGAGYSTTYCVPLPSPYQFFRVREGQARTTYVPPPVITRIRQRFNGIEITWSGPPGQQYKVEWSPLLAPLTWTAFTETVISTTGVYQYLDDGSQTGGFGAGRYYRIVLLP